MAEAVIVFYHSFPRPRNGDPPDKGFNILVNILNSGLMLVPEVIKYSNGDSVYEVVQCRFCLTEIEDCARLAKHAEYFGDFHLVFSAGSVYRMGAVPVMYVPGPEEPEAENKESPSSLYHLAGGLIFRLFDIQNICARIEALDSYAKHTYVRSIDINAGNGLSKKNIDVGQLRDILAIILGSGTKLDRIQGAVQAFASLFQHTDNSRAGKDNGELAFYRQHEWRIIQGITVGSEELDEELPLAEQKTVCSIDSDFFNRTLRFTTGEQRRIEKCRILRCVDEKPVQDFIDRIIVPQDKVSAARETIKKRVTGNTAAFLDKITTFEEFKKTQTHADWS